MEQYAGIDVSLESVSICVVDASGRIIREVKMGCEPAVLIPWFGGLDVQMTRIGLEAGPLSQWLFAGMGGAGGGAAGDPARACRIQGDAGQD
jgi:hypothetical protein